MKWHLFELVVLILAALVLTGAASGQQTTSATPQSPTAPYFTYAAGPNGCSNNNGFSYPDPATCIVPGEKPPGSFAVPAVGGSYADPNFGATVTILTNPNCLHEYSTPSAVSAHNKYVLTSCGVIELATAKLAFPYQPANFNEGSFWDALDDNVFYFFSGSKIMKRNLQGGVTVLVDYSTDGHNFSYITMGGT